MMRQLCPDKVKELFGKVGVERAGFVCAINGGRDGYNVPAALYEAGLLTRFVTDYYAPSQAPTWLPERLRRRRSELLPGAMVKATPSCFVLQNICDRMGLPMHRVYPHTDRLLAQNALSVAKSTGSHLYCYSSYLPPRSQISRGMKVIDFEYHPLPGLTLELLREDAARYAEVAQSWEREQQHSALTKQGDGWRNSDAVVCASQMTARSLEHAGCEAERITVIPYGFSARHEAPARSPEGPARFVFVGQGVQRKGLHHLLHAWRGVDPAAARLVLVCYAIDPGIAALADQPGVELRGRQDRSELDALLRSSDIFIMPSLVEGFGLVYLEALAAGCHVVGTQNSGLPDLPLTDHARTLVPVGDIRELRQAIERLIFLRQRGELDPKAIAAEAGKWSWSDFRHGIANHARAVAGLPPVVQNVNE